MRVEWEEAVTSFSTIPLSHNSRGRLSDLVAEHLDHLHYINDILKLNIATLNAVLADHLLNRLLVPLLVYSLNPRQEKVCVFT